MTAHNAPSLVRSRACSEQWSALHALDCHGIIRAHVDSKRFGALVVQGFAQRVHTSGAAQPMRYDQCDYVITTRGRVRAYELF